MTKVLLLSILVSCTLKYQCIIAAMAVIPVGLWVIMVSMARGLGSLSCILSLSFTFTPSGGLKAGGLLLVAAAKGDCEGDDEEDDDEGSFWNACAVKTHKKNIAFNLCKTF